MFIQLLLMITVFAVCLPSSAACPYKDALAFLHGEGEAMENYARSLRGLLGVDEEPHSDKKIGGILKPPPMPQFTRKPTKAPTASPVAASSSATAPFCVKTNGLAALVDKASMCTSYRGILQDFNAALPTNAGALSDLFGKALRLAFHDAGEVDVTSSDKMGPDGCMSSSGDNAGLIEANSLVRTVLEPIWQKYCDTISRADFWALFAKLVVEKADPTHTIRIPFQYGRVDSVACEAGAGRLPNAQLGRNMLQQVFVTQMGLTMNDAVTLIGAHTLGHVHTTASGYGVPPGSPPRLDDNAWDNTPSAFDNNYYKNLVNLPAWRVAFPNAATQNLWTRGGNHEIMLNTDMSVAFDISIQSNGLAVGTQRCGAQGAPGNTYGCAGPTARAVPSTYALAKQFADDNAAFLQAFAVSYVKMTTAGYGVPADVDGSTSTGKLGTLTAIDLSTC